MVVVAILNYVIIIVNTSDSWLKLGNCLLGTLRGLKMRNFSKGALLQCVWKRSWGHRMGFRQSSLPMLYFSCTF